MVYCDEKKHTKWIKIYQSLPTDVTLFVGIVFAQVSFECFFDVRQQPSPRGSNKPSDYNAFVFNFLITKVAFSSAHMNMSFFAKKRKNWLNDLKRNFTLLKAVFKFLTSPHQSFFFSRPKKEELLAFKSEFEVPQYCFPQKSGEACSSTS